MPLSKEKWVRFDPLCRTSKNPNHGANVNIVNNPFVLRQTPESPFSHYIGDLDTIPELVRPHFDNAVQSYREGVVTVRIPAEGFFSGVVTLTEGAELVGSFKARREGETPRKELLAKGANKIPAAQVDIVLYRSDVLAENGDNSLESSEANWEVISINASPVEGEIPINPMTLMHNHFGSDGGTTTNMTDAEFVAALREGFSFWSDKAMAGGA